MFPLYDPIIKPDLPILDISDSAARGLVGAFPAGERAGTALGDATGAGNSLALHSATWAPGLYGPCLDFNGTSAYADSSSSAFSIVGTTLQMSVLFCPRSLTMANSPVLMSRGYDGTNVGYALGWNLDGVGGSALWVLTFGAGGISGAKTAKVWGASDLGKWWIVTAGWDGAHWRIFVNGSEDTVASGSPVAPVSSSAAFSVGAEKVSASFTRFFDGQIAYVSVGNKFNTDAPGNVPDLWRPYQGGAVNVFAIGQNGVPGAYFRMLQQMGGGA